MPTRMLADLLRCTGACECPDIDLKHPPQAVPLRWSEGDTWHGELQAEGG